MQLFWHGLSSIRIESKSMNIEGTLLTDPFPNESRLRLPRTLAPDMLVLSHQDRSRFNLEGVNGTPFMISNPGEYEVKGIFAQGIQDPTADTETKRPIVFRFDVEGMAIAFLGQLKRPLTPFEVEALGDIDILALPVGGGNVLDAKNASDTISTVEPRIVIPLYYDVPGMKEKLGSVDAFCKQLGVCTRQDMTKLKIARKDLPSENMVVMVLERS
ncbi:MBL fold metallo-hydrolase [Patescibacteria group bacterium]|nr:MBL fold metallo-hydrolase [Patescibacteria group bacterium]MBU1448918.1 MBL fold metallo-hydrolase [Patescibacteria group bacterium]MBU2613249.1 MBL fold metallo-hydrolase [Patescibacteria group bacterium]